MFSSDHVYDTDVATRIMTYSVLLSYHRSGAQIGRASGDRTRFFWVKARDPKTSVDDGPIRLVDCVGLEPTLQGYLLPDGHY